MGAGHGALVEALRGVARAQDAGTDGRLGDEPDLPPWLDAASALANHGPLCTTLPAALFSTTTSTSATCGPAGAEQYGDGLPMASILAPGQCSLEITTQNPTHRWAASFSTGASQEALFRREGRAGGRAFGSRSFSLSSAPGQRASVRPAAQVGVKRRRLIRLGLRRPRAGLDVARVRAALGATNLAPALLAGLARLLGVLVAVAALLAPTLASSLTDVAAATREGGGGNNSQGGGEYEGQSGKERAHGLSGREGHWAPDSGGIARVSPAPMVSSLGEGQGVTILRRCVPR